MTSVTGGSRGEGEAAWPLGGGGYIPALDGIRALAVAAVLAFHGGVPHTSGGYLGVSLFFTLSGFLLTAVLLRERAETGRISIVRFWERRLRRLLPAAIVTLAAIALLAPRLGPEDASGSLRFDLLSALGYGANWRFLAADQSYASLFVAPSPVQHFWSLSIEEQFYIAFPLLLAGLTILGRNRRVLVTLVLGACCAASVAMQFAVSGYDRAYYGTDTRAGEILAGAVLACLVVGRERRALAWRRTATIVGCAGLVTFVALVAFTPADASWVVHGGFGAIAIVNVALIYSAIVPGSLPVGLLALTPLVAVGRVSYGLYLYHWPVFLWLDESRTGLDRGALFGLRVAVTAVVAVLSYHLLESPIRHRRFLVRRPHFGGLIAIGLAVAIGLAMIAPQPQPQTVAVLDERAFTPTAEPIAIAASAPYATASELRVMVVGDSTGSPFAAALSAAPDLTVLDATRPGCPILRIDVARRFAADPPRDIRSCVTARAQWQFQAETFDPDVVLVMSSFEDAGASLDIRPELQNEYERYRALVDEYESLADMLRPTGAVVAWADVPAFTHAAFPEVRWDEALDLRVILLNAVISETTARTLGAVTIDYASHLDRPDGSIDLAVRPDGIHVAPIHAHVAVHTWLNNAIRTAYREGRAELGLPDLKAGTAPSAPNARRVLVVGDSTSLGLATGLADHARVHRDLVVDWAGQVGCPLLDAQQYRVFGPPTRTDGCRPPARFWSERASMFRPDVVVVFSSYMDAVHLARADGEWTHVGQPAHAAAYAARMDEIVEALAPSGAVIVWSDAPRRNPATATALAALDDRYDDINELVADLDARWHHVVALPFAAYVDTFDDDGAQFARPDGVHFTRAAATRIADEWLADEVFARADAARAAAVACLSDSDAQPAISVAVCRAEPGEAKTE